VRRWLGQQREPATVHRHEQLEARCPLDALPDLERGLGTEASIRRPTDADARRQLDRRAQLRHRRYPIQGELDDLIAADSGDLTEMVVAQAARAASGIPGTEPAVLHPVRI
jgi:hypothetical protein